MSRGHLPKRTYTFIDAANIIYGARKTGGWKVDYRKLSKYLKTRYNSKKIFFYAGVLSLDSNEFNNLKKYGFILRLKEVKEFKRKPLKRKTTCPKCSHSFTKKIYRKPQRKANCDVDLTFDAMRYSSAYSRVIILSGDGDFYPLLQFLQSRGREVRVIAESNSTAVSIKKLAGSNFIDLQSIKHIIKK